MNTSTPVWLLDFDGVIHVDRKGAWPRIWNSFGPSGHYFRWAPELVKQIHRIYSSELVEIRWATSWCSRSEELEKVLGLPHLNKHLVNVLSAAW